MRKKTEYTPHPIDTQDVELSPKLMGLAERIAKNVHDVWSQARIEQGWTYGTERDDQNKKHPCLVPYEELSEEEKDYDRNTAIQTLKLVTKLGFTIE